MKKVNDTLILILGILLFFVAYSFDAQANLFFKNIKFPFFDAVLSIITNFGVVILVMLIIPTLIFYTRENPRFSVPRNFKKISQEKNIKLTYLLWLTFIINFILAFIIKLVILRQRPIKAFTFPFIDIINYSFPSMHSMIVFSLLPVLVKYHSKQKFFWVMFAFLVGISRIYLGLHFLSDVIFGALFGYFVGDWLWKLYEKGKLWK